MMTGATAQAADLARLEGVEIEFARNGNADGIVGGRIAAHRGSEALWPDEASGQAESAVAAAGD